MKCMRNLRQFQVTFATNCSQLVKTVSGPEEWPCFANCLEDIKTLKESFFSSEIIHVSWTQNSKADSLSHSVRQQPSFVVHMDAELPVWLTEFVWVCLSWRKKKTCSFCMYWHMSLDKSLRLVTSNKWRLKESQTIHPYSKWFNGFAPYNVSDVYLYII